MGDPVGIASLGIQVCQGLLQYYKAWKDYKDDIEATYERIESFEQTLLLLGNAVNQLGPSPDLLNQVADCIQACRDGIARLSAKFEKIKERTPDASAMKFVPNLFDPIFVLLSCTGRLSIVFTNSSADREIVLNILK
jgi:hypothetical protein